MRSRFLGTMTWCKETMTEHIGGWVLEPLFGSILAQGPIQVPPPLCFAHPTHPWFVAEDGYPHMVTTGLVDLSWLCVAGVAFCMWVCFLRFQVFQTLQLCHHSIGKAFCSSGLVGRGSLRAVGFFHSILVFSHTYLQNLDLLSPVNSISVLSCPQFWPEVYHTSVLPASFYILISWTILCFPL